MTGPCVVDAGVALAWYVAEADGGPPGADLALDLLEMAVAGDLELVAPELLLVEVSNVIWKLTRFRDYPVPAARQAVATLVQAPIRLYPHAGALERSFAIAADYRVTVYDASYVALAEVLGAPLVTTDARLWRALAPDFPWIARLETLAAGGPAG